MGNCLVIQYRKGIKVLSFVDGEILKTLPAPAPLPVSNKAVDVVSSDADYALQHGEIDMAQLYRVFHAPHAAERPADGDVVRVKLVISKQELRRMLLGKDGRQGVSVDDMVALMRRESSSAAAAAEEEEEMSCGRSAGWRPALQSIPEGRSDFFY